MGPRVLLKAGYFEGVLVNFTGRVGRLEKIPYGTTSEKMMNLLASTRRGGQDVEILKEFMEMNKAERHWEFRVEIDAVSEEEAQERERLGFVEMTIKSLEQYVVI